MSAYYSSTIESFLATSEKEIVATLAGNYFKDFAVEVAEQHFAWSEQVRVLKQALVGLRGWVYFEYEIPRLRKRIDVVILIDGRLVLLEFKTGRTSKIKSALIQVLDYALDLKYFHKESAKLAILPLFLSDHVSEYPQQFLSHRDRVFEPVSCSFTNLSMVIESFLLVSGPVSDKIDGGVWENSRYEPTPTIIEAAQSLYHSHTVTNISRSDSGIHNLTGTVDIVKSIVEYSKSNKRKCICFVTGVPGAGKTLAGLSLANQFLGNDKAVFLSGNGPLVAILREALSRDGADRTGNTRKSERRKVSSFIQNIHHFRDDELRREDPALEHLVIFDEAQRCWDARKLTSFMNRKKLPLGDYWSEPYVLINIMNRHRDWAVIVCLVGAGREIHDGEAGIKEWFLTIQQFFPNWEVYVPAMAPDDVELSIREVLGDIDDVHKKQELHLATPTRSFRNTNVSSFVDDLLHCRVDTARTYLSNIESASIENKYPIRITRSLVLARDWLIKKQRGTERIGLLASSEGQRLASEGLFVKMDVDAVPWFLNSSVDIRSSNMLELVSTEFQVQGLELDWACIAWDADMRMMNGAWSYYSFKGSSWNNIKSQEQKIYRINSYRVLLTRARQGMIIYVPCGDEARKDITRLPEFYQHTYEYLIGLGIKEIKESPVSGA